MADTPQQAKVRASLRERGNQLAPRVDTTEYVYVRGRNDSDSGGSRMAKSDTASASVGSSSGIKGRVLSGASKLNNMQSAAKEANLSYDLPKGLGFLRNRTTILWAWMGSMAVIGADEWKTNHIFPRPGRLWAATGVFALLSALSMLDAMVPLANALAIGYFLTVLWQFMS
jgi:hypothetical protein